MSCAGGIFAALGSDGAFWNEVTTKIASFLPPGPATVRAALSIPSGRDNAAPGLSGQKTSSVQAHGRWHRSGVKASIAAGSSGTRKSRLCSRQLANDPTAFGLGVFALTKFFTAHSISSDEALSLMSQTGWRTGQETSKGWSIGVWSYEKATCNAGSLPGGGFGRLHAG